MAWGQIVPPKNGDSEYWKLVLHSHMRVDSVKSSNFFLEGWWTAILRVRRVVGWIYIQRSVDRLCSLTTTVSANEIFLWANLRPNKILNINFDTVCAVDGSVVLLPKQKDGWKKNHQQSHSYGLKEAVSAGHPRAKDSASARLMKPKLNDRYLEFVTMSTIAVWFIA